MRLLPKVDLALVVVIVCIAMTLAIVVVFAAPGRPAETHRTHPFPSTKESSQ